MAGEIVFVDTETTGLDHRWHEIIDIWAAVVRPDTLEILQEAGGLVTPQHIERAHPRAIEVNGYDSEKWRLSEPFHNVWDRVSPLIRGRTWAGQNIQFDIRFIRMAAWEDNYKFAYPKEVIDTKDMAKELLPSGVISNTKMDTLCQYFGIDSIFRWGLKPHGAKADVYRTIEVYRKLREVLKWDGR